jgi:hypothetical protein
MEILPCSDQQKINKITNNWRILIKLIRVKYGKVMGTGLKWVVTGWNGSSFFDNDEYSLSLIPLSYYNWSNGKAMLW